MVTGLVSGLVLLVILLLLCALAAYYRYLEARKKDAFESWVVQANDSVEVVTRRSSEMVAIANPMHKAVKQKLLLTDGNGDGGGAQGGKDDVLAVGSMVETFYQGGAVGQPGLIVKAHGDGFFDIDYDDGHVEVRVRGDVIKLRAANTRRDIVGVMTQSSQQQQQQEQEHPQQGEDAEDSLPPTQSAPSTSTAHMDRAFLPPSPPVEEATSVAAFDTKAASMNPLTDMPQSDGDSEVRSEARSSSRVSAFSVSSDHAIEYRHFGTQRVAIRKNNS